MLNVDLTPVEINFRLGGPLGDCGGSAGQGIASTAGSSARQIDLVPGLSKGSPIP